jgi:spore coat polysaccharide biosynthesis predicted glycosyltransferase SpsG
MILNVFCKASVRIGLGHLIRSYSFASQVIEKHPDIEIVYYLIGDISFAKLIDNPKISLCCIENEKEVLTYLQPSAISFIDMVEIDVSLLDRIKQKTKITVALSPVFNHFGLIDFYFGRTKYLSFHQTDFPNLKIYAGLEYAIIQKNCTPISSGIYEENLKSKSFPVAISMGGGDAQNKTLEVLRALKSCNVNATFWVMVGEGYKHSFNELIDEVRSDTAHEIILAKTNRSMWNILKNCVLCILPGGITSFEAAYAGLPTLNFFEQESQRFLLQELVEHKAAIDFGLYSGKTLETISEYIEKVYASKKELLQMHINTKFLIDGEGANRIFNTLTTL